jgi:hypothetical protein
MRVQALAARLKAWLLLTHLPTSMTMTMTSLTVTVSAQLKGRRALG